MIVKTIHYLKCGRCNETSDDPFEFFSHIGDEAVFLTDQMATDRGWLVDADGEHICDGCRDAYEAEERELARARSCDEWLDDPRYGQAKWINAGGL